MNVGDQLLIRQHQLEYHVTVCALSILRKAAKEVHLLYQETPESIAAREAKLALLRAEHGRALSARVYGVA